MSQLTAQEIEENGICPDCKGNAKYQKQVTNKDGTTSLVLHFCESCLGTGRNIEDGDVD